MLALYALASALFSGIAVSMVLAPHDCEGLAFVAFAPLLVAASRCKPLIAVGLGLLAGLVGGISYVGWHHDTMRLFWAYLPFLWVATILAILCLMSSRLRNASPGVWMLALSATAVTIEFATTLLPLPINIAIAVYKNAALMTLAPITGIWGVSFILWLSNALAASLLLHCRVRRAHVVTAALIACMIVTGIVYHRHAIAGHGRVVNLVAIQDFTGDETMTLTAPSSTPVDRNDMTAAAARAGDKPAVIVWSEECLGSAFHVDNPLDGTVRLARSIKTALVVDITTTPTRSLTTAQPGSAPTERCLGSTTRSTSIWARVNRFRREKAGRHSTRR